MSIKFGFGEIVKTPTNKLSSLLILAERMKGKTHLAAQLPKCTLIDLAGHAKTYSGNANVWDFKEEYAKYVEECLSQKERYISEYDYLLEYSKFLKALKTKPPFIVLDSATEFERICLPKANELYRRTKEGSTYTGEDVLADLAYGGGNKHLKNAGVPIIDNLMNASTECTIVLAHLAIKSKVENNVMKEITDADLSKTFKNYIAGKVMATGTITRANNGYDNELSFRDVGDTDIVGGRNAHIRGQKFIISTLVDDNGEPDSKGSKIETHWELVFPDFFKELTKKSK